MPKKKLTDEEKLGVMNGLKEKRKELLIQLNRLPLAKVTLSTQEQEKRLE